MSSYDNVDDRRQAPKAPPSEISELTEFSDPWTEVSQNGIPNTEVYNVVMPSLKVYF